MLLKFQEIHGRNPGSPTSEQDKDDLVKIKNEVLELMNVSQDLVEDFARFVYSALAF